MRPLALPSLIVLVTMPGCKVYDPLYCDDSRPCTDPARPFCDVGGDYPDSEGVGHTCIPQPEGAGEPDAGPGAEADAGFSCTPGTILACSDADTAVYCDDAGTEAVTVECGSVCDVEEQICSCEPGTSSCSGDQLVRCDAKGQIAEVTTCALGCDGVGPRCFDLDPSNGLAGYLDMADSAPVVTLSSGATIDTSAGTIRNGNGSLVDVPVFQIPAPPGGIAVRIFAVQSLTIADATVTGDRALAIVSDGDILIQGHVLVLAGAFTTGSCAGRDPVTANDPSEPSPFAGAISGAGGGGFGAAGAPGGTARVGIAIAVGASGGSASGTASLVPLRGGCAGGALEGQSEFGGAGGGAVQLVSRTSITVTDSSVAASIDGGGRGGRSGVGGTGGGSGGGILLEAPLVSITRGTAVAANGGGGAAGCGGAIGGEDASPGSVAARGGSGCEEQTLARFGDGGSGGAGGTSPSPGDDDAHPKPVALVMAGGGGGAVGRIRINVARPDEFSVSGTVSPTPSVGAVSTR